MKKKILYKIFKKIDQVWLDSKYWYSNVLNMREYRPVPFLAKIEVLLAGFAPSQYHIYKLDKNDKRNYIKEIEKRRIREINGKYQQILENKYLFYENFKGHIEMPTHFYWICKGLLISIDNKSTANIEDLIQLLMKETKLILKPVVGSKGKGIILVQYTDSNLYFNGDLLTITEFKNRISALNEYLIVEYICQAKYSNRIYSHSVNTIRVITIQDPVTVPIPKVILAIHRFGSSNTQYVDNASAGGLFSKVDVNTGVLTHAQSYLVDGCIEKHPDTNEQIGGIVIPHWNKIKTELISTAKKFPYLKFIGWDIAVTENGFQVVEANLTTGLNFIQSWQGERFTELGEFYKSQGLLD